MGLDGRYTWTKGRFFPAQVDERKYSFNGAGLAATVGYRL